MDERDAYLALNLIPQLTPRRLHALVERLGSAVAVWRAPAAQLVGVERITPSTAERIVAARAQVRPADELALAQRHGIQLITHGEASYPAALAAIHDPSLVLYLRGQLLPQDAVAVAIVGSRRASLYGLRTAERLAGELAERGVTVVSGLARGIDAAAHRGALRAGGRTLAVLGSGLLRLYPEEHAALAVEIAAAGAVLSEFPLETPPLRPNFPRRNRLISGLALGVVVVEAAARSGALITVACALEQGRDVFAVPGSVDASTSRGTNELLRDGARLVTSGEDIVDALALAAQAQPPPRRASRPSAHVSASAVPPSMTPDESTVLAQLSEAPQSADALAAACGWPAQRLLAVLTALELKRAAQRLPGQQFVKAAS